MKFSGFHDESFQFFKDLKENNDPAWFEENESALEEHVLKPFRELVEEMRPFMTELDPSLAPGEDVAPHLSLLERGTQVPPGTPPYKTSLYAYFWNTELKRLSDATLYVGIDPEGVRMGFSIYDFGVNRRARIATVFRPRLQSDLQLLDEYIKAAYLRRGFNFHRYARAAGRLGMRQVEAFPERGVGWDNTLGWVVSRHLHIGSSRLTPGSFVSELQDTFNRLYPLYTFCSDPRPDWKRRMKKAIKG